MPTTKYIWDEENDSLLGETDENGMPTAVYTMLPEPFGRLISEKRGEDQRYHHFDALGSTRELTDEAGDVTDTAMYDAWGNIVARTGTSETPFLWNGEWGYYFDSETSLHQVRRRSIDPAIARWMSCDPLERILSLSSHLSLQSTYLYARNRPCSLVDPSGAVPCPERYSVATYQDPPGRTNADGPNLFLQIYQHVYFTADNCGKYGWEISWSLRSKLEWPSVIIQDVRVTYDIRKCKDGSDITKEKLGRAGNEDDGKTFHFWEGWQVAACSVSGKPPKDSGETRAIDNYEDNSFGICTYGTIVIKAIARVYIHATGASLPGQLPSSFKPKNPQTQALLVPSTAEDPKLGPGGSTPTRHDLTVEWNCCEGTPKPFPKAPDPPAFGGRLYGPAPPVEQFYSEFAWKYVLQSKQDCSGSKPGNSGPTR